MAGTAPVMRVFPTKPDLETNHDRCCSRLRTLAARHLQLSRLHHVRVQLLQAADRARLANLQRHAQRGNALAVTGPYARIRHPQYVTFVLILFGFLLQWPTLLTLVMFPILLLMYGRLTITEEADMRARFGDAYERYVRRTPRFFSRMGQGLSAG